MKNPRYCWQSLVDDFASYEMLYGEDLSALLEIALRMSESALNEWSFPYVSGGKLMLSRFETYKDMLLGPHVLIRHRREEDDYEVEFKLNETVSKKRMEARSVGEIDFAEVERWLDLPLIDGLNT